MLINNPQFPLRLEIFFDTFIPLPLALDDNDEDDIA